MYHQVMLLALMVFFMLADCAYAQDRIVTGRVMEVSFSPGYLSSGARVLLEGGRDTDSYEIGFSTVTADGKTVTPAEFVTWATAAPGVTATITIRDHSYVPVRRADFVTAPLPIGAARPTPARSPWAPTRPVFPSGYGVSGDCSSAAMPAYGYGAVYGAGDCGSSSAVGGLRGGVRGGVFANRPRIFGRLRGTGGCGG